MPTTPTKTSSNWLSGPLPSLGVQAVRDGRDLDVVTGAEIPRVVKGRLRAINNLSASSPRSLLDAFSGIESLEHTMPLEEVCRLTVEASDTLSIAFIVCGSRLGLSRLRNRHPPAFPDETAVIAVVCDERAHPRLRPLGGLSILTIGLIDDLGGSDAAGGSVMSPRRFRMPPPNVTAGSIYVLATVILAAIAAWPIYASRSFVALVAAAALTGGAIAVFSRRLAWPVWLTASVTAAAVLVLGLLFAVPVAWGDVTQLPPRSSMS